LTHWLRERFLDLSARYYKVIKSLKTLRISLLKINL
jgi:hypothetical protein